MLFRTAYFSNELVISVVCLCISVSILKLTTRHFDQFMRALIDGRPKKRTWLPHVFGKPIAFL